MKGKKLIVIVIVIALLVIMGVGSWYTDYCDRVEEEKWRAKAAKKAEKYTCKQYDKLEKAIRKKGISDVEISFSPCTKEEFIELKEKFYQQNGADYASEGDLDVFYIACYKVEMQSDKIAELYEEAMESGNWLKLSEQLQGCLSKKINITGPMYWLEVDDRSAHIGLASESDGIHGMIFKTSDGHKYKFKHSALEETIFWIDEKLVHTEKDPYWIEEQERLLKSTPTPKPKYDYNPVLDYPKGSGKKSTDPYDRDAYDDPDEFAEEWAEEFAEEFTLEFGQFAYDMGYDEAYDYWEFYE